MKEIKTLFKVANNPILFDTYTDAIKSARNQANKYNCPMNISVFTFACEYGEEMLLSIAIAKRIYPQES